MNLFELFVKIAVDDQASDKISSLSSKIGNGLKTAANIGATAVGAAVAGITALTTVAINSFAEYEQLAGGAQKIFDQMDYSKIAQDANNAYKELGLSVNQYLDVINDVGATFAATMGDEAGYEAAKTGLKAISDYASGTGKNVNELSQKFTLITRSTASYQSIADQFSGILPATSDGFLEQAQAAGLLSDKYTQLTEVPIAEYQEAVSKMLEKGVSDLGLANNTMDEAFSTLSGSLAMARGAWSNLVTGLASDSADLDMLIGNFVESVGAVATNLIPKIGTALNGASKLVRELIPVIVQEIPVLIDENLPVLVEAAVSIIQSLVDGISQNQETLFGAIFGVVTYLAESFITMLPQIVQLGLDLIVSLANGIATSLPEMVPTIVDVILQIVDTLINNVDMLVDAALSIVLALADGIINSLPTLIEKIPEIITSIVEAIVTNAPKLLEAALQLVVTLGSGLVSSIPSLLDSVGEIASSIISGFSEGVANISEIGQNIINGLWSGIVSMGQWINDKVSGFFSGIVDNVKNLLGIHSPSTVFSDVGVNIVNGVWEGIKAMGAWIRERVSGFFSGIVDSVKGVLGIHSPSKVFASIGGFMAEGLGEGWDKEYDGIKKKIEDGMDFGTASVGFTASGLTLPYSSVSAGTLGNGIGSENGGQETNIVIPVILDGKQIGEASYKYIRKKERMVGA